MVIFYQREGSLRHALRKIYILSRFSSTFAQRVSIDRFVAAVANSTRRVKNVFVIHDTLRSLLYRIFCESQ